MTSNLPKGADAAGWSTIRQRLALAAAENAERLTPEQSRAVLDERARRLAQVADVAAEAAEVLEILTFSLSKELYGIETGLVLEVRKFAEFTPVPGTPEFLIGITNLRGEMLPVVDLRKFFGIPVSGVTDLVRNVVLGVERPQFCLLADAVHDVRCIRKDELLDAPASVSGIGREYLRGVTSSALIVLNGAALLQDRRLVIDHGREAMA